MAETGMTSAWSESGSRAVTPQTDSLSGELPFSSNSCRYYSIGKQLIHAGRQRQSSNVSS